MMSGIRGKDTKPELAVRSALHRRGLRFRLHAVRVPGRPDMVFPTRRAAVFVHGCFWHGHDCRLFKMPSTRQEFWRAKIGRNRERDAEVGEALRAQGWRRLVVWECALKRRGAAAVEDVADRAQSWLLSESPEAEIRGP